MKNKKTSLTVVKGIGKIKEEKFARLGIFSIEDALHHYPRSYEDRSHICTIRQAYESSEKEPVLINAKVIQKVKGYMRSRRQQTLRLLVEDETDRMTITFFQAAYVEKKFEIGNEYMFFGRVQSNNGSIQMIHPDFSLHGDKNENRGLFPVYPLTSGITQSDMRSVLRYAVKGADLQEEYLPTDMISDFNMCSLAYALKNIHFPQTKQTMKEAKFRLVFDELFLLQLGIALKGEGRRKLEHGISFSTYETETGKNEIREFESSLIYELTNAQKRVIREIEEDMNREVPMNRLIQGDVGSGKTVVAQAALCKAVKNGYQGVMMAPTEILARQHYDSFTSSFEPFGINVGFLASSMTNSEKKNVLEKVESGEIDILIGTHAVIQPGVIFKKLGLVVTDEQHRFGVAQRRHLLLKGSNPDVIVMTATPIPRTLALVVYGDLDVSSLDELPPGRKPVKTKNVTMADRHMAYDFLKKELEAGRQAYIVTPLIEDSEELNTRSATAVYEEIKNKFSTFSPALLHGDMKQNEKKEIMELFNEGKIGVLVSTVIIEVGINVPNASVMIIENAERFGLSQLHQLRGRVGRGTQKSYCILISDAKTDIAKERMKIMEETNDGFVIAEKDLLLRGPGEFFGTRQHGIPEMKLADFSKHMKIFMMQKPYVKRILSEDEELTKPENNLLREKIDEIFSEVETGGI